MPVFLYPFVNTSQKTKPFENLRVASLGIIAALVKVDDSLAVNFLISSDMIPQCLKMMSKG